MSAITVDIHFPDAGTLDYTGTAGVLGYHALWSAARGCLSAGGAAASREVRSLDTRMEVWLRRVEERLMDCPLPAVAALLPAYVHAGRVCRGAFPAPFTGAVVTDAVRRWLGGERTITATDAAVLIETALRVDPKGVDRRHLRFMLTAHDRWINELRTFGRFRTLPAGECYRRLSALLRADLSAYFTSADPQENPKRRWVETHMAPDLTRLTTPDLLDYHSLIRQSLRAGILSPEYASAPTDFATATAATTPSNTPQAHFRAIRRQLHSRPDLHPLHRQALSLTL